MSKMFWYGLACYIIGLIVASMDFSIWVLCVAAIVIALLHMLFDEKKEKE